MAFVFTCVGASSHTSRGASEGRGDWDDEPRAGVLEVVRGWEHGCFHQRGIAFPQGSLAPQARAGSDPDHETKYELCLGFRGCRS